ncbi:hypothetical protein D7Z26_10360 [Cohnella endophytica]|uniref:Uncharacterized protein n=1 Tax=Cohnella endophytica TaxID=2419778 RepID=A0A494Y5I3_9BACL|nr:hypothetical protein [Cohnella endophytica]RKP55576.1 hypothetical protein D7Z26_10360 [Cohnella endophytica]
MLLNPVVSLSDQIAIIIGLFAGLSGVIVTAVGIVIAGYTLRRKDPSKTPDGKNKRLYNLLTYNFVLLLSPIITTMMVIFYAMQGEINQDKLFYLKTDAILQIFLLGLPFILNLVAVFTFLSAHNKDKPNRKYLFESILCGLISVFCIIFFSIVDRSNLPISILAILCFAQLCFGLLQSWLLIRKE